jgi:ribonuclease PH
MTNDSTRPDGRRPDELRPVHFTLDYVDYPEGSVLIEVGRTRVLCNVSVGVVHRAARRLRCLCL